MLSRTATTDTVRRQRATMRQHRRHTATNNQLYCRTNGCATHLTLDEARRVATCPVCGYRRRLG